MCRSEKGDPKLSANLACMRYDGNIGEAMERKEMLHD